VDRKLIFATDFIDTNRDGSLSNDEAVVLFEIQPPKRQILEFVWGVDSKASLHKQSGREEYKWVEGFDANGDGLVDIQAELEPVARFLLQSDLNPETYREYKWWMSHAELEPNVDIIGNVTADILILQGLAPHHPSSPHSHGGRDNNREVLVFVCTEYLAIFAVRDFRCTSLSLTEQ